MIVGLLATWLLWAPPTLPPLPGSYEGAPAEEPAAPTPEPSEPSDSDATLDAAKPSNPASESVPAEPSAPRPQPKPGRASPGGASPAPTSETSATDDPAAVVPPPDFSVELPPEFEQRNEAPDRPPPTETRPDPAGVVLGLPADEPTAALPGDPVPDRGADVDGVDGPIDPAFENVVSVRTAVERTAEPPLTYKGERPPPERGATFVFGYRSFAIADALARRQTWHVASIELTPLRRYARLNLITEAGWEGGEAAQRDDRADFMLMQKVGFGAQYPHWLTPLVEFQAGMGIARIEMFERNDLATMYSLGIDAGAQWAVTKRLYLVALVGWLRPHYANKGDVVYYDRGTFKLGIGF